VDDEEEPFLGGDGVNVVSIIFHDVGGTYNNKQSERKRNRMNKDKTKETTNLQLFAVEDGSHH
jgi:hypothetical protein